MTAENTITKCFTCNKKTSTFSCRGCSKDYCRNDLTKHLQALNQDLDDIGNDYDQFRQNLLNQKHNPNNHPLIKQINRWEEDSIEKIKQTANQCKDKITTYINKSMIDIETKLNNIAKEMKTIREENEFNEIDIDQYQENLIKLKEELNKPLNVSIKQEPSSFINKIFISPSMDKDTKWKQRGIIITSGNAHAKQLNKLCRPAGICFDDNQTLYIADCSNHRILSWKINEKNCQVIIGEHGTGNNTNQLNRPKCIIFDKKTRSLIIGDYGNKRVMQWFLRNDTKAGEIVISNIDCWGLAMNKNGDLYVSDWKKHEIIRWRIGEKNGAVIAGGNGRGAQLNQLYCPTYIAIDQHDSLYISDFYNHRVIKWNKDAKEGIVVAGGNHEGHSLRQICKPQGLIINDLGQVYVADYGNHRIVRWYEGDTEGSVVVDGITCRSKVIKLEGPSGLSFDHEGNLYVSDWNNNRIQKYEIE